LPRRARVERLVPVDAAAADEAFSQPPQIGHLGLEGVQLGDRPGVGVILLEPLKQQRRAAMGRREQVDAKLLRQ